MNDLAKGGLHVTGFGSHLTTIRQALGHFDQVSPTRALANCRVALVDRFEPAKETSSGDPPHQREIVFGKYLRAYASSARPIFTARRGGRGRARDAPAGIVKVLRFRAQVRRVGDRAFRANRRPASRESRLVSTVSGSQSPHCAADQGAICAFSQILFRRNTEAIGDNVQIRRSGRALQLRSGPFRRHASRPHNRPEKSPDPLIPPHAIEKIVSISFGARFDPVAAANSGWIGEWRCQARCDSHAAGVRSNRPSRAGTNRFEYQALDCRPARVGRVSIVMMPLAQSRKPKRPFSR